jgi:branched-chain amino acid transport system permease protein
LRTSGRGDELDIEILSQVIITGIINSAVYAVMATGLTLVYGATRILNFAHGSLFAWGAYLAWVLSTGYFRLNYALAVALTVVTMFFLGLVFERVVSYPLRRYPEWQTNTIIVTLGAALFLDNLALVSFGPRVKRIPRLLEGNVSIVGVIVDSHDIVIVVVALVTLLLLGFFLKKTWYGMAVRAVAQDATGARIVGLNLDRVFMYTLGISSALAGISGILLGPKTLIFPHVGWEVFAKAFVVIVLGGLGSVKGTLYAAIILGMVEVFVTFTLGAVWGLPVFIGVLLLVLVSRPKGLFGTGE